MSSKFINRDNVVTIFEKSLGLIKEKKKTITSSFLPASITECPRRLCYKITYYYMDNSPYDTIAADHIAKKWVKYLEKCKGIRVINSHVIVSDEHFQVAGIIDSIIDIDDEIMVFKVKEINDDSFKTIQSSGALRRDVVEIMVYMWLAEMKSGLLVYENKNNNDVISFRIDYYQSIIQAVKKLCEVVINHKKQGVLPNRPYDSSNGEECNICEFKQQCWEK